MLFHMIISDTIRQKEVIIASGRMSTSVTEMDRKLLQSAEFQSDLGTGD